MENLAAIILACVGCTAFWQLLDHVLERRKKSEFDMETAVKDIQKDIAVMQDNQASMQKSVDCLSDIVAQNEVVNKRVRILSFADDMMDDKRHSKDAFDQVMSDIDGYEAYCDAHPNFKNNQTEASIAMIKEQYRECLDQHTFLQWRRHEHAQ